MGLTTAADGASAPSSSGDGTLLVLAVTVFWYTLEALVHYNIGRNGSVWISELPPPGACAQIIASVLACALLSGWTVDAIRGWRGKEKQSNRSTNQEK